jgi:hypothetical protein
VGKTGLYQLIPQIWVRVVAPGTLCICVPVFCVCLKLGTLAGGMAQEAECLLSKCKTLSSNSSTSGKKKKQVRNTLEAVKLILQSSQLSVLLLFFVCFVLFLATPYKSLWLLSDAYNHINPPIVRIQNSSASP